MADQVPAGEAPPIQQPSPTAPAPAVPAPTGKAIVGPKVVGAKSKESIWTLRRALPRAYQLPFLLALPFVVAVLWCALTLGHKPALSPFFLPSPIAVLQATVRMLFDGTLAWNIAYSVMRIAISFAAAALVAIPLGVAMASFEPINRLMEPIMAPMRYLPISAFIPLLILWLGIGEQQKIVFLFLGVFVFLLPVVVTAIRAVPEELVQTALTLGATKWQVIRTVLVPAALPDIFDAFRVMNAISWTYVILAEMVNASRGLGYMIQLAGNHFKIDEVFSGILVIGVIGLLTDALIRGLNHLLFSWREAEQ